MKYWLVLIGCLLLSLLHDVLAQDEINLATIEYPPYSGKQLKQKGLITQIVTEAYERVGYQVHIHFFPWARATKMTRDGELDGMVHIWMREPRKAWVLYSDPMPASNELVFYKRADIKIKFDGQDYLALKPYTIGTGRSYANPPEFERVQKELRVEIVTEDIQNLQKLESGRIDLAIVDKLVAQYILNTQMPTSRYSLDWVSPSLSIEKNYVGISKKTTQSQKKIQDFNRGLALLNKEGRVQIILAEHGFTD